MDTLNTFMSVECRLSINIQFVWSFSCPRFRYWSKTFILKYKSNTLNMRTLFCLWEKAPIYVFQINVFSILLAESNIISFVNQTSEINILGFKISQRNVLYIKSSYGYQFSKAFLVDYYRSNAPKTKSLFLETPCMFWTLLLQNEPRDFLTIPIYA